MAVPLKIGNFEVIGQIGSGGMGNVYLARDPELDRQVAIKVIREEVHDQEVLDRFFREARATAALRHANVITVYASGQEDHKPYIAMEFIEGESFSDVIRAKKSIPLVDKLSYIEQLCAGLAFAHKAGIVHRDVKPANVMIDREGVVRILDFGIARIEGSAMTVDGTMMGSLNYMSPEQMLGKAVDQRSDIFSVGCVAYELLCFQQAFKGNLNDGLLHRLPNEDPPLLKDIDPSIPLAIEQIVMRALEKDPGRRYQNLSEMRTALVNAQAAWKPVPTPPIEAREERTEVVDRPPTVPSRSSATTAPLVAPVTPRTPSQPMTPGPVGGRPQTPPSAPPFIPSSTTGLKLKGESNTPPRVPTPVEKPPSPPKNVLPSPGSIQLAPSAAVPPRRRAFATPPSAQRGASSKKGVMTGVAAAVIVIGLAAAAVPWFRPAPNDPMEIERPRIEAAMGEYRNAYRNRNLEGITNVFPTLPADTRRSIAQAFSNCLVYEVTFSTMQVTLNSADPTHAQVDVRSAHTCTPNSGRQTETSRHDLFSLAKNGNDWVIESSMPVSAGGPK